MPPNPLPTVSSLCAALRSAIATASSSSLRLAEPLHAHILKTNLIPIHPPLSSHLASLYSKSHLPVPALLAFLLSPPTPHSLPIALLSSGHLLSPLLSSSLHSLSLKTNLLSSPFVSTALLDAYAKCGCIRQARAVFEGMARRRSRVSWGAMVDGYCQVGGLDEAVGLVRKAVEQEGSGGLSDFVFASVLRGCGEATRLVVGRMAHGCCFKCGFRWSPFVGAMLVFLYSRCGLIADAYKVFDETSERNVGLWNAMISACAQHGHFQNAFELYHQMDNSLPNFVTFLHLLHACSHAGLVDSGKHFFQLMKDHHGIDGGPQHYACMVDLLGRAGMLGEAVEFISKMPMKPNEAVWAALLTGCQIHNDKPTAAYAILNMKKDGVRGPGASLLVCSAYAATGEYKAAAETRKAMRDGGLRKERGMSWVELGNETHTFTSGDRKHERSKEIIRMVEVLQEEMRKFPKHVNKLLYC